MANSPKDQLTIKQYLVTFIGGNGKDYALIEKRMGHCFKKIK
jgi:hypothetical protein